MKKNFRAVAMIAVAMLFVISVGASLAVQAKTRKKAAGKKSKAVAAQRSGKKSTARVSKKSSGKKKQVASRGVRSRRSRSSRPVASKRVSRSARNRVVKASGGRLSRSARRRRARALALARMRAARARDAALNNITVANIQKDSTIGEDPEIRQATLAAMSGRSATAVVMDPNTGRVYTIVNQRMALGSPVKPCSTVKVIVSLAALHESVFDPTEYVRPSKYGPLTLTEALAHSDNPFFQGLGQLLGYDRVIKYADNFGFGQKTGVNYAGESDGFLPEEGTLLMSSHGDGFGVTAMQLATFTSAIANGGSLYVPRVPRTLEDASDFKPELKRKIEMSPEDRAKLMSGMIGAVNYGTARRAANPLGQVAGKTGTCTGDRDKLRLFTSFSSVENPKLVVTVITTDSKFGGNHATEIAGKIYAAVAPRFFRERMAVPAAAETEIPVPPVKIGNR